MWHKAIWKGHPMRLELTRVGLLVELSNHYTTKGASIWDRDDLGAMAVKWYSEFPTAPALLDHYNQIV